MKAICNTQRIQGILWLVNGDGIERKRAQVCEAEPEAGWGGSELPDSHRPPPAPPRPAPEQKGGLEIQI